MLPALWLAACSDGGDAHPNASPESRPPQTLDSAVRGKSGSVPQQRISSPTVSPTATTAPPTLSPVDLPVPASPSHISPWITQRLDAVITIYGLTPAGENLVESLDLRHMRGEPGFFGSYGFKGWAGVGEAKPMEVMHEISHSYWGAFPVEGLPRLSWDKRPGQELSSAIQQYHADILAFMAQPPDDYEVFRQRLRNLPGLSSQNPEPLLHSLEADMVYHTGGDLALVPPILQKYWSKFLDKGPFGTWYDAVAWYQSLPSEDRGPVNNFLGFQHLDLRGLVDRWPDSKIPYPLEARKDILAVEQRQRLFDLADQFDLLIGDPQKEENFEFWRRYLRDKLMLQRSRPDYLINLQLPRAIDLAQALDYLNAAGQLPVDERAVQIIERLPSQPFLINFLPVLDNPTLLAIFASNPKIPQGNTLQATASFVERLSTFSGVVEAILAAARTRPGLGTQILAEYLESVDYSPEEDLKVFFDLLRDADPETAAEVVAGLDKSAVIRLIKAAPFHLRTILSPSRLLSKLDVAAGPDTQSLIAGARLLIAEPSGNYVVDEPYLSAMYQVVAEVADTDPAAALLITQDPLFPLEGLVRQKPSSAVGLLGWDISSSARLVRDSDPILAPPARIIYRLISADPSAAATILLAMEDIGEQMLVSEALGYIAYDCSRRERFPGLSISLERDGEFLEALVSQESAHWLEAQLDQAFSLFGTRATNNQVGSQFLIEFGSTLEAAAATVQDPTARGQLNDIIFRVTSNHGAHR